MNAVLSADSPLNGSAIAGAIASADALIGSLVLPPVGMGYLEPSEVKRLNRIVTF